MPTWYSIIAYLCEASLLLHLSAKDSQQDYRLKSIFEMATEGLLPDLIPSIMSILGMLVVKKKSCIYSRV